jgi:hypothetical protein
MIDTVRGSASSALTEIDKILHRFHGQRLSGEPTALGTILVEANEDGIAALSKSEHVKAVLRDQPIAQVS